LGDNSGETVFMGGTARGNWRGSTDEAYKVAKGGRKKQAEGGKKKTKKTVTSKKQKKRCKNIQ